MNNLNRKRPVGRPRVSEEHKRQVRLRWMEANKGRYTKKSPLLSSSKVLKIKPAIIKKKYNQIPNTIRLNIWNREYGEATGKAPCFLNCGREISSQNFHCAHIISRYNGGSNDISNLIPVCMKCNSSIGTRNVQEFIREYGVIPKRSLSIIQTEKEKTQINNFIQKLPDTFNKENLLKQLEIYINKRIGTTPSIQNIPEFNGDKIQNKQISYDFLQIFSQEQLRQLLSFYSNEDTDELSKNQHIIDFLDDYSNLTTVVISNDIKHIRSKRYFIYCHTVDKDRYIKDESIHFVNLIPNNIIVEEIHGLEFHKYFCKLCNEERYMRKENNSFYMFQFPEKYL